jgi:hypothetical protein
VQKNKQFNAPKPQELKSEQHDSSSNSETLDQASVQQSKRNSTLTKKRYSNITAAFNDQYFHKNLNCMESTHRNKTQNHAKIRQHTTRTFGRHEKFIQKMNKFKSIDVNTEFVKRENFFKLGSDSDLVLLREFYETHRYKINKHKVYEDNKLLDEKGWLEFFKSSDKNLSTNLLEHLYNQIDRTRIRTGGNQRNLGGGRKMDFKSKLNAFFNRNFGENLEAYRKNSNPKVVDKIGGSKV